MRQIRRHTSTSFPRNFLKNQACWPEPPGQARTRSPSHLPGQTVIGTKALSLLFLRRKVANPEELIAAAHAGCFTMALAFQLQGVGYTPTELRTEAAVTLDPEGQDFRITRSPFTLRAPAPNLSKATFPR